MPGQFGNKGGGRWPARKEREQLLYILEHFVDEDKVEKLKQKKKLSIRDIYLLKAINGSESILNKIADKILPDKLDFTTDGESLNESPLTEEEKQLYAEFRLGILQAIKRRDPKGTSGDLGNG